MIQILRRAVNAMRLGPSGWRDIARASLELALANRRLGSRSARELLRPDAPKSPAVLAPGQARLVERVAYVIPRMGELVPWRADCLVQALAAQRWLERAGVASDICIGVRRLDEFEAHAWLKVGDRVVTGGDISSYQPILTPSEAKAARRTAGTA